MRDKGRQDMMLAPSPRVPVRWPSQKSVGGGDNSSCCGSLDGDVGVGAGAMLVPTAVSVFAAAEEGNLSLMTAYLSGGGNMNKRSKVCVCACARVCVLMFCFLFCCGGFRVCSVLACSFQ